MNLNGWKNSFLQNASSDFDMMMAFDWAARQYYYVDGDSDLYDQEFYINAKGLKDKNGKLPYGYHGMLIKDAAYRVYEQVYFDLLHDLAEIIHSDKFYSENDESEVFWYDEDYFIDEEVEEIEEALWEFLEAYKTLSCENLFEEAVHKNTQKK